MQPLAAWQAKLAELEVACRNAEALMLQAPTRAERSAALDLAGVTAGGKLASRLDDYAAVRQLSAGEWRQHRRQEAAWQAALRQELAALQAEGGDV
ncbi:hypothetical protein OEZ86_006944 [Tetradesmus obliquus]|nr:hypothetical protein OEZ86_006944 [Tetradesmus obliquus]